MDKRNEYAALVERARDMVIVKVDTPPYRPITPYPKLVDTILELAAALKYCLSATEQDRAKVRREAIEMACAAVCPLCKQLKPVQLMPYGIYKHVDAGVTCQAHLIRLAADADQG